MSDQSSTPDSRPARTSAAGCLRSRSSCGGSPGHDLHAPSHSHRPSTLGSGDTLTTPEWCAAECHLPAGEWKNYAGGCDRQQLPCRMIRGELPV